MGASKYKPPDIATMGKKVQVKFSIESNEDKWFDGTVCHMVEQVESMV